MTWKQGQVEFFLPENSSSNLVPWKLAEIVQDNNVNMTETTLNPHAKIPHNPKMWESVFVVRDDLMNALFSGFFQFWASRHTDIPALPSLQTRKNLPKKRKKRKKKTTHTNTPPFSHFSLYYPPMESAELHNRCDPAGHSGLDSLGGGLISRCGRSRQEEVTAQGMLGLTEAVINYGLLPLVMHEKPTESTKRSLNQGAYFKGNLATFYWQDAVSVGGLMTKTVCSACCTTQEAEFYRALFWCFFYQWHSCWPSV